MNEQYFFHLSLPVKDVKATREYYEDLGFDIGRTAHNWIDVNFWGHQITFQKSTEIITSNASYHVSGSVPVAHFGVILPWSDWNELKEELEAEDFEFYVAPRIVFEGKVGEQHSFFLKDPSGYAIEFKSFEDQDKIFATE